ncbi:MAG: hypothetical protein LBL74_03565 [Bacteroidales bacterium]|nr:hypothetical protein [Bacteroidales bacterium]
MNALSCVSHRHNVFMKACFIRTKGCFILLKGCFILTKRCFKRKECQCDTHKGCFVRRECCYFLYFCTSK